MNRRFNENKIKIYLLVDQLVGTVGGTEQHVLFLLNNLPKNFFDIYLFTLRSYRKNKQLLFPIEHECLNFNSFFSLKSFIKVVLKISNDIKKNDINILYSFYPDSDLIAALISLFLPSCKVISARRNMGYYHSKLSLWRSRFFNQLIPYFIVNCKAVSERIGKLEWIPKRKIKIILNPLNTDRIADRSDYGIAKNYFNLKSKEKIIGIVATVRPVKDHRTFIEAAKIIHERLPETKFIIVGRALLEGLKTIENLIHQLKLDRCVHYVGEHNNPIHIMQTFDVGVLCSKSEGLSNTLIEYAGLGIPIVATDVGGSSEIVINGKNGFLVKAESAEKLAEAVIKLLNNSRIQKKFRKNSKIIAEKKFNSDTIINEYVSYFRHILHKD